MQLKYRLYRRRNGIFYWQENDSSKQGTLRTSEKREAERLLNAMNESHREPTLNLNLARAYLAAHDPKMAQRTWQEVMDEMATHGIPTTQERCARGFRSKAYDPIRNKPLVQTTGENCSRSFTPTATVSRIIFDGFTTWRLISVGSRGPSSQNEHGPKSEAKAKERSLPKNMQQSSLQKKMPERRAYYELLYETGAAQTDAANLTAEDIDWQNGVLVYRRKKLGPFSEPCRLTIGNKLRGCCSRFRHLAICFQTSNNFCESSIGGISSDGVELPEFRRQLASYRHAWAQRAKACGYPQRFAQEALGHSSRAVHEAYAKGALVILPALDEYEQVQAAKVIPLRSTSANYSLTN